MKVCGIVSEYNPFHNGHKYQIDKTREITGCDYFIAVMSGNFMQRGNIGIFDKWTRAEMALRSGIDLVLELPAVYSLSSAESFAFGGVSLLNSLNLADYLSFGSESGDINSLYKIGKYLAFENEDYKKILKFELHSGNSFHKSRASALSQTLRDDDLLDIIRNPNNILGIEYIKSLIRLDSSIRPVTIKRINSFHNDESLKGECSSANSIRKVLYEGKDISLIKNSVPDKTCTMIDNLLTSGYLLPDINKVLPYIKHKVYMNDKNLRNIPEVKEGLDNKIIKEINKNTFNELVLSVKSKRYTYTRISRILLEYFLGFENFPVEEMRKKLCPYARILGANDNGRELIRLIKKKSSIPIINKIPAELNDTLRLEINSTKNYSLINENVTPNDDYLKNPIIL